MAVKRLVDVDFWENKMVLETMSAEDRYFYLFLLTNPCVRQLGVYRITLSKAVYYTGYNKDSLNTLFDRFENSYGMIRYNRDTDEVAIKNYLKHSIITGGKPVLDLLLKDAAEVKDKSLLTYIKREYFKSSGQTNATVAEFLDTIPDDNDDDEHNDNDDDKVVTTTRPRLVHDSLMAEQYEEILSLWNSIEGVKKCRSLTDERKRHINARVKEYSYEEVIDVLHMISESPWLKGENPRHWCADFDWWLVPNNFAKILEGKYTERDDNTRVEEEETNAYQG